jgi:hypothetical protein
MSPKIVDTDKVDYILSLSLPISTVDSFGLVRAYCFCLKPSDACDLLCRSLVSRLDLRDSVLRKICADIKDSFADCHRRLLEELIYLFANADSRCRQSIGFCLSMIADVVPVKERRKIQKFFLSSKYIGIRRRGYKCISADTVLPQDLVYAAWEQFGDSECAWVIVKEFPPMFLVQNRTSLTAKFTKGWQIARLYLRIAEVKPNLLDELRRKDEISFCYVLAKLNLKLTLKQALKFIENNSGDERFGLLVWSFGQLGLWEALQKVELQLPCIQEQRFSELHNKYTF